MKPRDCHNTRSKEFVKRDSLLTDLFENVHLKSFYRIYIVMFLVFFINTVTSAYLRDEEGPLETIKLAFAKVHVALILWIGYYVGTCFNYCCFMVWARRRQLFYKTKHCYIWDRFWLAALIGYYLFSFQSSGYLVTKFNLAPASSSIVLIEQTRLLMKIHSFVRTNSPKVLQHKPHTESELLLPTFSHFVYFTFVPTLIYSDVYPRTEKIRWSFVFFRFLEVVVAVLAFALGYEKVFKYTVSDFGLRKYTVGEIILCLFENSVNGFLTFLVLFILLTHSWYNLFAELTRFGDRSFYTDWWTATNVGQCLRRWHTPVQDWLYFYVCKEFHESLKFNKHLSKIPIIIISGIVHDFVTGYALGLFFPVMFVFYTMAIPFVTSMRFPENPFFKIFTLYFIFWGTGGVMTLYGLEYFARINTPLYNPSWKDTFVPRFLTCDCISFK